MPVTYLDLFVIGIVLVSALLAMLRGFTREVLAIASWAVAAVAAYAFYPMALPYAQQYIPNKTVALAAAAGGIFLVTLIIAYFITAKLSDVILDSRVGALDRTLGFLFGALRGFLISVILFLFFQWLVADKMQPIWVKEAKTRSLLESSGNWIKSLLPDDPEGLLQQLKVPKGDNSTPPEPVPPTQPAQPEQKKTEVTPQRSQSAQNTEARVVYGSNDKQDMQRLLTGTSGQKRP